MESFPLQLRLRAAQEFDAVFKQGDFRASERHLLCLARGNRCSHARLGMVVSKRNVPLAVQRNRIKRVIRESFRRNCSNLPHCDVVLLCRQGLAGMDNRSIDETLAKLWDRLRDGMG